MSYPTAVSVRANGVLLEVNKSYLAKKFASTETKETFPITSHLTCKSSWLIICRKCAKQYIGLTETALKLRLSNTRSEIKKLNTKACHRSLTSIWITILLKISF